MGPANFGQKAHHASLLAAPRASLVSQSKCFAEKAWSKVVRSQQLTAGGMIVARFASGVILSPASFAGRRSWVLGVREIQRTLASIRMTSDEYAARTLLSAPCPAISVSWPMTAGT